MSYILDLEGMLEKLLILQHFAFGSKKYCQENFVGSDLDIGDQLYGDYWGYVKGISNTYILDCSVRFRVLVDTISEKYPASILETLDESARYDLIIGQVLKGKFKLSLRESCNKIIHAKRVIPIWKTAKTKNIEFKYWGGFLSLSGNKGEENWHLQLNIPAWALAIEKFIQEAESKELTIDLGQDWF